MSNVSIPGQISVLVVDDSNVFRRVLREIFEKNSNIRVVGEAVNGIQALEMLLKVKPDVIIMDLEMPLMDGLTALQHLMIHKPIPTIIFSSLTKEGSVRCFDAMKYGAVDFVCKDFIFQGNDISDYDQIIIQKVVRASKVTVRSVESLFNQDLESIVNQEAGPAPQKQVLFCEDCGAQVCFDPSSDSKTVVCDNCGDIIDISFFESYRRNNFVTVIGAGEGGYRNLLNFIPRITAELNGAIIVVLYGDYEHVGVFTEYLDSITDLKVQRIKDGISIEGGNCYIASGDEYLFLKPFSAHYIIRSTRKKIPGHKPLDMAMNSIATIFRNKVAGIIVSGSEIDGELGVRAIHNNGGKILVLNPNDCFCKSAVENIMKKCTVDEIVPESDLSEKIKSLHKDASVSGSLTA